MSNSSEVTTGEAIHIRGLSHHFGEKQALKDIDWVLPQKGIVGLVGPNGAGKTTLFSLIAGFLTLQKGTISVLGESSPVASALMGRVGVMPQDAIFARDISIFDQLLFLLKLDGYQGEVAEQRVREVMQRVGLETELFRGAAVLSHGMGKRLGVAQAILAEPEIVLLDEPTAGLDPANARQIRHLMRELAERSLVIVSSHNLLELQDLIDSVGVIVGGELISSGTVEEVTRRARRFEIHLDAKVEVELVVEVKQLSHVNEVEFSDHQLTVSLNADQEDGLNGALSQLYRFLIEKGQPPHEVREGASLEQAYLKLTGEDQSS